MVGGTVTGKLTSSNVDPVQASFATCKQAKKVMGRATELGVEEPRAVASFYCRPTVSSSNNDKVSLHLHLPRRRHGDLHQAHL